MVLLDSRTGTITRKEPVGTGYIIGDPVAPTEAEAGSTVVITTDVYCGEWGD